MIPIIYKLGKKDQDYQYGFYWEVRFGEYTLKVRTFTRAFQFWKQEVKIWASKKLHFKN